MIYTLQENSQLPTITEVLEMARDLMTRVPLRHRMPYDTLVEGDDKFLLNRTASGLFTFKPNITRQTCLFYGDNDFHKKLQAPFNILEKNDYLIENVLREEFEITMDSHPLYRLFKEGIPTKHQTIRIINPFGLAMAYGFPTTMLPFSSSLEIAAFFATHRRNEETGEWQAIPNSDDKGNVNTGVLYVLALALPFPMMLGLSSIGMQAFKRPGAQKMFGLSIEKGENYNNHRLIYGFHFRQDSAKVTELDEKFYNGKVLTPDEYIAKKAETIRSSRCISENAFRLNCKNNPSENPILNKKRIIDSGIQIVKDDLHSFTERELSDYYNSAEAEWNEMFGHVVAVHPGFDRLLEELREFPNTEKGKQFFRK